MRRQMNWSLPAAKAVTIEKLRKDIHASIDYAAHIFTTIVRSGKIWMK